MVSRTAPDDENSGDVVPSSDWNNFPRGEISRKVLSANSSGTTTTETILSETVVVGTTRCLQIHATVTVRSDMAGGAHAVLIFDDVQVQRKNIDVLESAVDFSWTLFTSIQPAAGTYTVKLNTGASGAAGNTVTAIADGATGDHGTCVLVVLDVGPAYS